MDAGVKQQLITVTPKAKVLMADYFKDKALQPIRIYVRLGGCGMRTFGIALEAPKRSDAVIEVDGYTYVINRKLLKNVQPIKIDSDGIAFRMSGSGIAPPQGCGGCGNICGVGGGNRCLGDCANCDIQCGQGLRQRKRA